jgi:ATP-dependent helicase YprA (DUF1998 family)
MCMRVCAIYIYIYMVHIYTYIYNHIFICDMQMKLRMIFPTLYILHNNFRAVISFINLYINDNFPLIILFSLNKIAFALYLNLLTLHQIFSYAFNASHNKQTFTFKDYIKIIFFKITFFKNYITLALLRMD